MNLRTCPLSPRTRLNPFPTTKVRGFRLGCRMFHRIWRSHNDLVRHHVSTHGRVHGPGEKNMTNRFLHIYSIYIIIILHHSSLALFVGWFQGDRGGHPKFAIGFWHLQEAKFHIGVRSSVVATPSIKIRQVSQTRSSRLHHVAFY